MTDKKWAVGVYIEGEQILIISDDSVSGLTDLTEEQLKYVSLAGQNLVSFAGKDSLDNFIPDTTLDGECSCACIDCIEGNHCGGQFYAVVNDNGDEELVGECKDTDGIINSLKNYIIPF